MYLREAKILLEEDKKVIFKVGEFDYTKWKAENGILWGCWTTFGLREEKGRICIVGYWVVKGIMGLVALKTESGMCIIVGAV